MNFSKQSIAFGVGGLIIGALVATCVFHMCSYGKRHGDMKQKKMMHTMVKEESKDTTKTDSKPKTEIVSKATVATTSIEIYKQWAIPASAQLLVQNEKNDSVSMELDYLSQGDLLSTLIVDSNAVRREGGSEKLQLSVYTTEYLRGLERDFARFTQANKNGDFYAAYVTNLGSGIDVAAGKSAGKTTTGIVLVRVNGTVYELQSPQSIFNKSATGASVSPCDASLKNKEILWTCFEGFATAEGEGITGSQMSETRYSLTGKKLGTREYSE